MLPDLKDLLCYENPQLIQSFVRNFNVSQEKANDLFYDVLRYLWVSKKHAIEKKQFPEKGELQFILVMHEEMREIDNMWHHFILYTRDYTHFCEKYFGEYLHHQPDINELMVDSNATFAEDLKKFLSYVYDQLGSCVLERWFAQHL